MNKLSTITELFKQQVAKAPNSIALQFRDQKVSYKDLDTASNQIAQYLKSQGVAKGDRVAFILERSPILIETILGIVKSGAAYVPIDPNLPSERIDFIVQDSEAKLLLTTQKLAQKIAKTNTPYLALDAERPKITSQPEAAVRRSLRPHDLLYIIYTSGSTGTPKGVMVPHRGVANLAKNMGYIDFSQPQTFLLQTQISFDVSGYELYSALLNGATLAIAEPQKPTPDSVIQATNNYGVTVLSLTTGLFHFIVDERVHDLQKVKYIIAGGDVMLPHLAEKAARELPNATIINGYGPTENSVYTTAYAVPRDHHFIASVPIGATVSGTETYVLNKQNQPVKAGETGELAACGVGVALGYWKRPDTTAERFIPNPFSKDPADKLYKTGDLVRQMADGVYEFLGRIDQQVKIRGFRIELGDIENTILKDQRIQFCAVTVQEFSPGDKRLVAHIVPRNLASFKLAIFKTFLTKHLPEYMIPAHIIMMEKLPMNASGKIDKKALPKTVVRPDIGIAYTPPKSDNEIAIAKVWRKLLGIEEIGINDNFFDLGGNSMLAARVTVELQKVLQQELSASALYDHPTIAQLAKLQTTPASTSLDLGAEVRLDDSIQPEKPFHASTHKQKNILLTGATGFLGAFLMHELLQKSHIKRLFCLVRADDAAEGMKRIKLNMEKYLLWDDTYASRLTSVPGHLDRPQLGLDDAAYKKLAAEVDNIYHNGAKVNYIQSYQQHKAANVTGTQHIIELACRTVTKPIHFLSTIVSFGPLGFLNHTKTIFEDDDLDRSEHVLYRDMGYAQSKWVAEKILLMARDRGVPSTILRPGFIMGESKHGVNNTDDFVARLIKGCIQLGSYPYLSRQRKEFTPVDFVAKAIVHISESAKNLNHAYHLVPPHQQSVDLNDFFVAVREQFGYQLTPLAFADWAQKLADSNDPSNPMTTFMPLFFEKTYKNRTVWELYENMSAYDSSHTQTALQHSNITCPEFDANLMQTYFNYMIDIGYIPAPPANEASIMPALQLQPDAA